MNHAEQVLAQAVKDDHAYIVALRRYFHMHPELSGQEDNTAQRIEQELDQIGLKHHRIGSHSVYSEIHGEQNGDRIIVLRADIDALPIQEEHESTYRSTCPGVMHACGHDGHAAGLIGAARVLKKNRSLFGGTVRLVFQEGEETGIGGVKIAASDALNDAGRTFGMHVAPDVPVGSIVVMPGPNNPCVDFFKINVQGKSAHVSTPQKGVDAAYIAAHIVVSLQAPVTRTFSPMDNILLGVGKITAGSTYNIVAQTAEIEGTARAFTPEIRQKLQQEIKDVVSLCARMYGGSGETEFQSCASPVINDEQAAAEVQQTASSILGREHVICSRVPTMAGDDMSELLLKVPGVYAFVGSANPDISETQAAQHNSHFDIDEDALLTSVSMYAGYAADYLNQEFGGNGEQPGCSGGKCHEGKN